MTRIQQSRVFTDWPSLSGLHEFRLAVFEILGKVRRDRESGFPGKFATFLALFSESKQIESAIVHSVCEHGMSFSADVSSAARAKK
jgi:hypothetical protein